jgi:hypothetical protein
VRISELVPPPGIGVQRPIDWKSISVALGTPLPGDYQHIVETYGGGVFGATFEILYPGAADPYLDLANTPCARYCPNGWVPGNLSRVG